MKTIFNQYWQRVLLLSFGHGLNDFIAGYMLGNMLYYNSSITTIAIGFFIYNLLAFGGQYFVALFFGNISNSKLAITISIAANMIAILAYHSIPQVSLVLAGCASAVYHVIGGTVCANSNKAAPIGVFASPGILGLAIAGYLSYAKIDVRLVVFLACLFFIVAIQLTSFTQKQNSGTPKQETNVIDSHDMLMIFLLAVIALRSAVWNIFQVIHEHNYSWLLAIAISACIGKMLGGWLSDKVGWRVYSFISLIAALPLVSFFKNEILLFCIGIGLLQSAIPANTMMMINYCKGEKERGVALSFGVAVAIGMMLTAGIQIFQISAVISSFLFALLILSVWLLRGWTVTKTPGLQTLPPSN